MHSAEITPIANPELAPNRLTHLPITVSISTDGRRGGRIPADFPIRSMRGGVAVVGKVHYPSHEEYNALVEWLERDRMRPGISSRHSRWDWRGVLCVNLAIDSEKREAARWWWEKRAA